MPEEFNLSKSEEKVLKFWDKNQIFEKTLAAREGKKKFVFYEGPPYANGRPGIHHVLARVVKDVILRYKTMRGYYVPRRAGWDTHGLPVEMAAEKALGLKSKKDIEKFGIKLFNKKAEEQVWVYKDEWEEMTRRIGYWLDLKNAYVTYAANYIETIWWTIAHIARRKLLYKGHKVVPWCTRCGTALSSHELALGYKETEDNSVYVKFKLKKGQKIGEYFHVGDDTHVLSWTTTPWTLPGNVALAVGTDIKYAVLKKMVGGKIERWIIAHDVVKNNQEIFGSLPDIREVFHGRELIGLSYEPLFDVPALRSHNSYKIYAADFVNIDEGSGVVHTAVMYGEDDYQLGVKVGLPQHHIVQEDGKFKAEVRGFGGLYVKAKETEEKILNYLASRGYLLTTKNYVHEYPYCWRCDTPVLYYARTSWFIAMSKLRGKLLAENEKINWIPEHLKNGRFGEWLREVKDWNLSRERYWGAPLPIWECKKCGQHEVIGSLDELSERAGGSKNKYWVMRHGEAESNIFHFIDSGGGGFHLTPFGKKEVAASAEKLKARLEKEGENIDLIFSSDVRRTKESEKIVAAVFGVKNIHFDKRLEEVHLGELQGCHDSKYHRLFPTYESKFAERPDGGESLRDLRLRVWNFMQETEKRRSGKNILIISHEYPIWMLFHAAEGWDEKGAIEEKIKQGPDFINVGEVRRLNFKVVPRNDAGEVDLHRPYADDILITCKKCSGKMRRVREVADVWYDSGAMPLAQFPKKISDESFLKKIPYPADYIAEGMDQTRGWFYTLLAIAVALGYEAPYKNVISLGLINDKNGQKMSKSKGNVINPWEVINKYGIDAVRWYFYTINPPGETKNFNEAEILKVYRRMHLLLWNSLAFYKTYAGNRAQNARRQSPSNHILDQWISLRLYDTIVGATKNLNKYEIREAALLIEKFVDDLSRWYIRRSRRRLQRPESKKDFAAAAGTLGYVLRETAKLAAPFTPFFSEILYQELSRGFARNDARKNTEENQSVHLEEWPETGKSQAASGRLLLKQMAEVRRLASLGFAKRAEAGIKIRQPIASLKVKSRKSKVKIAKKFLDILKDEVNAKEIFLDEKLKEDVELDTTITPELREEGILREIMRVIQDLRQRAGLKPKDKMILMAQFPAEVRLAVYKNEKLLKSEVGARGIEYKKSEKFDAEAASKIDGADVWLGMRKI